MALNEEALMESEWEKANWKLNKQELRRDDNEIEDKMFFRLGKCFKQRVSGKSVTKQIEKVAELTIDSSDSLLVITSI